MSSHNKVGKRRAKPQVGIQAVQNSILGWILKSERIRKWILRFLIKQLNPRGCVKGTEGSTSRVDSLEVDSSVPTHYGLICLVKKRHIRFRILSDAVKNPILDSLKETHP